MALIHQFVIVEKESNINLIEDWMDKIDVSDNLILYIADSLKWMKVSCSGNLSNKNGLDYYGYTIIKEEVLNQLESLETMCKAALERGSYILHNAI